MKYIHSITLCIALSLAVGPAGAQKLPSVGKQLSEGEDRKNITTDPCDLSYTLRDKKLYCKPTPTPVTGGSGSGDEIILDSTVTTVHGQSYAETPDTIKAGSTIGRCFAKVLTTVGTSDNGPIQIGTNGARRLYGVMGATAGATNTDDTRWPTRHAVYTDMAIRVTAFDGATFSGSGTVRIVCYGSKLEGIP